MKLRLLFLFIIVCFVRPVMATHIVGGEFELEHTTGSTYRLTLNLYFDNLNGDPDAIDPFIIASIFDKQTNQLMQQVQMPRTSSIPVAYTSIACTNASLSTNKFVYRNTVQLSANRYTNPEGYYVVWERCCRNNVISNIQRPQDAGQAFYLEFPAVVKNNQPFINSSPRLFPPLSDYACINDLFYYDFSGTDTDGDSLVYEMVTPFNGFSTPTRPLPSSPFSGPYPIVLWTAGLGVDNQIPGNPSVSIDRFTGRLTVQPSRIGLFVFGVRCQEYRGKVKIGETRRDFQLLVLNCPTNAKPQITARAQNQPAFYREGDTLRLTPTGNRCLDLFMTDSDSNEPLTVSYRPVNFSLTDNILSLTQGVVNQGGEKDSLKATVCFPGCLDSKGKTYLLDVIVKDNGCSLPKADTIRLTVIAEPFPNEPPQLRTLLADQTITIPFGSSVNDSIIGLDPDANAIVLQAAGEDFDMATYGMQFKPASGNGSARTAFSWTPDCRTQDRELFKVNFSVQENACQAYPATVKSVTFVVEPPKQVTFTPANIFTPNGDGRNDFFEMPNLPPDYCESIFDNIKIFNRWGSQVYSSNTRTFKWNGQDVPDGVYYYLIKFSNREYKGHVTLVH